MGSLVALASVPSLASADAGTPLMWYGCCWLFVGNAFIGLFEAWIIGRRTRLEIGRLRLPVIAANYASAFIGFYLLFQMSSDWVPYVASRGRLLWLMWACAFLLTMLVETPFVAFAERVSILKVRPWMDSLVANALSYALVMPLALLTCVTSLATQASLLPGARAMGAPKAWVYYVRGENVRRVRTDGSADEPVMAKPAGDGTLFAEPAQDGSRADLVWVPSSWPGKSKILLRGIGAARQAAMSQVDRDGKVAHEWLRSSPLQFTEDKSVGAEAGFWPALGLSAWVGGRSYNLAFETPFAVAAWRDPTLLPGAFLVVGLGDKIVLLNLRTRDLAILVAGDCPAVLLDLADAPTRPSNVTGL